MGYRTQNNLDEAEREAWRKLPWRERYDWRYCSDYPRGVCSGAGGTGEVWGYFLNYSDAFNRRVPSNAAASGSFRGH